MTNNKQPLSEEIMNEMSFMPMFKEKSNESKFKYENGIWIEISESEIMSLWYKWSVMDNADSIIENGYYIFGINK